MTTNNNNNEKSVVVIHVGIDIGSESTKVVLGSNQGCEIVRNDVGGHTTPTSVSFALKQPRQIGSTANSKTSITGLLRLLDGEIENNENEQKEKKDASWFGKFDLTTTTTTNDNDNDDDKLLKLDGMEDYTTQLCDCDDNKSIIDLLSSGFTSSSLLAMLLGNIETNVQNTLKRISDDSSNSSNQELELDIMIPHDITEKAKQQLLDAVYATGLSKAKLVDVGQAYLSCYQRKFPQQQASNNNNNNNNTVILIDMGKTQTTVTVFGFGGNQPAAAASDGSGDNNDAAAAAAAANNDNDEEEEKKDTLNEEQEKTENNTDTAQEQQLQVLSSVRDKSLGAGCVDIRLWDHFESTMPAVLSNINPKSRAGQRMLEGTKKLKHLLSQLPEGTVTVENIGANDTDVKLSLTRSVLAELCQPESKSLTQLIQTALDQANVVDLAGNNQQKLSVEITGGGCRIPWVKQTIVNAINNNVSTTSETKLFDDSVLAYSMDDTSASSGAALYGEKQEHQQQQQQQQDSSSNDNNISTSIVETETRKALRDAETAMKNLDQQLRAKADILNKIEAHVLELRSAKHDSKYGSLVPAAELDAYLDQVEDWLFSEEVDTATLDKVEAKYQETVQKTTKELAKDYFEAKEKDQAAKDAEMEAEAKRAQAENDAAGADGEEDDHDNRRLPKKRRMEIVMKNKAEANELFGDGNYRFAAARYNKALSHCAKFVDLSPDDIEEVNTVKLSLNLNLALAYLKLDNPDQALRVCNDAITIDGNNTKALYRRSSVYYEKKNWDLASKDVKAALKIAPDDKALKKLQQKIDAQVQRQKLKEKKMAQKMFG